jgi:hypothetical protein
VPGPSSEVVVVVVEREEAMWAKVCVVRGANSLISAIYVVISSFKLEH